MAITAQWTTNKGTKTWQVTPSQITSISNFSTAYELNAEDNNSVEGSPLSNQRGMKKKTMSFSTVLTTSTGIDVRAEFESWESYVGQYGPLKIGGKKFGPNWLLNSVKPSDVQIDDSGRFRSMKLTFSFEETDDKTDAEITASVSAVKSAVSVTASAEAKEIKKTVSTAVSQATKTPAASSEIALGDVVQFLGGPHYVSSTATSYKVQPKPGPAKVTAIAKGARHPYHIIHTTSASTVYGWVDASQISKPISVKESSAYKLARLQ